MPHSGDCFLRAVTLRVAMELAVSPFMATNLKTKTSTLHTKRVFSGMNKLLEVLKPFPVCMADESISILYTISVLLVSLPV